MRFDRFCRKSAVSSPPLLRTLGVSLALLPLVGTAMPLADAAGTTGQLAAVAPPLVVPKALQQAKPLGRLPADTVLQVAVTLPWRNAAGLDDFVKRVTDPNDPLHGKFLTHQQFVDQYSPTQADYDTLKSWAQASGLSVTTMPNRMVLVVSGKRDVIESAFHVTLNNFQTATGRVVYFNDTVPKLPQSIAQHVSSVIGLTNFPEMKPHYRRKLPVSTDPLLGYHLHAMGGVSANAAPGNGPGGGLTPADIQSIYSIASLNAAGLDGSGQTVALYEQNGYLTSDIVEYASFYGLAAPNLQNITIGGYDGSVTDTDTQGEVTLDIEMILAVAPKAKILVYEFDDTNISATANDFVLQTKIVDDNLASVISVSYGGTEDVAANVLYTAENELYKQMIAQGQCMWASSGDDGAYSTGAIADGVSVSDPASQPLVVGVGGTSLNSAPTVSGVATYGSETTWVNANGDPSNNGGGSGGGVSIIWPIPSYQTAAVTGATTANKISTSMRNVPDVSFVADPATGPSVFQANSPGGLTAGGVTGFNVYGGTSAACPLWAGFNALINQQRAIYNLSSLGFANPPIYTVAEGANYGTDFHDIKDGSNNLFYPTVVGFDDATGWGSYVASSLLPEFAPSTFGSQPINVLVVNANGSPVSGATVAAVTPQISEFVMSAISKTDGTATITVPTGVHNYNNTGTDVTLSFIVSAELNGYAGSSQGGVAPPTTTPIVLHILPPDHTYASGTLQMISAPYDYSTVGDFATLFGLTPPIGTTSGSSQLFAYSPTLTAYLKYPTAPADTLRLGQGYWAVLPNSAYVRRKGVPAPTNQAFRINLLPGWNMIGDPFTSAVSISNIQVDTVNPGSPVGIGSASTVQLPFYSYNGSAYQTLGTGDTLQPFQGYWIHASQAAELVIPVP